MSLMDLYKNSKIFRCFCIIVVFIWLPSCFFTFKKNNYESILNEKLEQERRHKGKIKRLERENRILFHRNLDLEKTKKLKIIQLKKLRREYNDLDENFDRVRIAFSEEKKNLHLQINILKEKGEKKISQLLNIHKKQREELQKQIKIQEQEYNKKINLLSIEMEKKEKNWTNLEFSYKKDQRLKHEKIEVLEKQLEAIRVFAATSEEKSQELEQLLSAHLGGYIKAKDIVITKKNNLKIWINNKKIYLSFQAEWKKDGLKMIKKIFSFYSKNKILIKNFFIKISVFTSSRWLENALHTKQMITVPIGPPPRDNIIAKGGESDYLKYQWKLANFPYPVALSTLRAWRWEKFFYKHIERFKNFSLEGIPKPNRQAPCEGCDPWEGATIITFIYLKKEQ